MCDPKEPDDPGEAEHPPPTGVTAGRAGLPPGSRGSQVWPPACSPDGGARAGSASKLG